MTQEFHLSITPLGQDRYLVRTEEVAPGVPLAEEQVSWPVEDWLQESAAQASDPLMSLFQAGGSLGSGRTAAIATGQEPLIEGSQLIALGQALYSALFQGRIRDSWLAAQGVAQNRRQVLRLRLGFKDSRLQRLPWEVLYGDDRPLATGTDIVFARYYVTSGLSDLASMPRLPAEGQALQVLMVVCAPDDQERLALRKEVQRLKDELHPATAGEEANSKTRSALDIQLTILEQPGRAELVQALEQGQYQVLHYAGHSDVSETGGDLYLVSRQTGLTERLSGEDLAGLLVNNGIHMAVFNSCRGAYTAADDAEAGWREQNLVQALMNRGVPGVIAMAERIPDDVAITFTQLLYRNLKQGFAIDLSLSRTRQGLISTYGSDQSYWMLPILYLQPDFDGYLFASDHAHGWADEGSNPLDDWLLDEATDDEYLNNGSDYGDPQELDKPGPLTDEAPIEDLLADLMPASASFTNRPEAVTEPDDFNDLLDTLGSEDEPSYEEDAEVVTHLIQQLSSGPVQPDVPLEASQEENLLPDGQATPNSLHEGLPVRPQPAHWQRAAPQDSHSPNQSGLLTGYAADKANTAKPRWWPLASLLPLVGLGLVGAIAAVVLATSLTSRQLSGIGTPPLPTTGTEAPPAAGGQLVTNALREINQGNFGLAQSYLETLIEAGSLSAAESVLLSNPGALASSAELSYVQGRLIWEQIAKNTEGYSANDARRSWENAVEVNPKFTNAWVALGFAYAYLGKSDDAIKAWERAIALDQSQVRDGAPGQVAIADPFSLNAHAGLAVTYYQLSQLATDNSEKARQQDQALREYQLVVAENPSLINADTMAAQSWLWPSTLLAEWQKAVEGLAQLSPSNANS